MSFLSNLFRSKKESSADVARERLLTVLVNDRVKLTPEMLEQMKVELSEVIARYVPGADAGAIEVRLQRGEGSDHLTADIPLRRTPN